MCPLLQEDLTPPPKPGQRSALLLPLTLKCPFAVYHLPQLVARISWRTPALSLTVLFSPCDPSFLSAPVKEKNTSLFKIFYQVKDCFSSREESSGYIFDNVFTKTLGVLTI